MHLRRRKKAVFQRSIVGVSILAMVVLGARTLGKMRQEEVVQSPPVQATASSVQASSKVNRTVDSSEEAPLVVSSQAEPEAPVQTEPHRIGMQVSQLLVGDFSSLEGAWVNAYGQTLTFSASGLVSETSQVEELRASSYGTVKGFLATATIGGGTIDFIPSGQRLADYSYEREGEMTLASDASDHSLDRIWLGQDLVTIADPASYFYRVHD